MKVILTGASGMLGKGILLECLEDPRISQVLAINRSKQDIEHPKLKEVIHRDFSKIEALINEIADADACFFAMGVSAVGKTEKEYNHLTFEVAAQWADLLHDLNPNMTFNYISGQGTDSSEKGSRMWARVKGKTENYILNKGFADAYMFRPGAVIPEKGIKSKVGWYSYIYTLLTPFFGLLKRMKSITTTTRLGKAMINSLFITQELKHLENSLINKLSGYK